MKRTRHAELFAGLEPRVLLSDDHANLPDFGDATEITFISRSGAESTTYYTSLGAFRGELEKPDDTDLFRFVAPGDAPVSAMSVYQRDLGVLAPAIQLRASDGRLLMSSDGDAGVAFVAPSFGLEAGETYYVVVLAGLPQGDWETATTGRYAIFGAMDVAQDSAGGSGGGSDEEGGGSSGDDGGESARDDYADRGDTPHPVFPSRFNGDVSLAGGLQSRTDSDAFSLVVPGQGPVRVQLLSDDADFAGEITVLDASGVTRAISSTGLPGAKATVEFTAARSEQFTVIVESPRGSTGDYRLTIDTSPALYHYFYPAGYSSETIDEFVPMVNPNEFDVSYTVLAHYESGEPLQVLDVGVIAAHSRAGITVTSRRNPGGSLTRVGEPYAFEIIASGPIGATLGHYDFGTTTGESFTDQLSTRWEFPEVRRDPGMQDLLVYYNPNPAAATVTLNALDESGVVHRVTRRLEGERRGGVNVATDRLFPGTGVYAVWIESDLPIVAAHTTFDVANGRGDGYLGQPSAGSRAGALPALSTEPGTETRVAILNASGSDATLRLTSSAWEGPRSLTIEARSRLSLTPADLGLSAGRVESLMYLSDVPVTISAIQYRHGDGDAFLAASQAATTFVNGAAWVNPRAKDTYIERLGLLNPGSEPADIKITFLFTNGSRESATVSLAAGEGRTIRIDQHPVVARRAGPTAFSLRVDSSVPIIASFAHYDLYLNGGWGSLAAPMGLAVPTESLLR